MTATTKVLSILWLLTTFAEIDSAGQIRAFDYATPAFLDFDLSEISVSEDQTTVTLNLHRSGDFRQLTRVDFSTEALTATEGADYKGTGGTLTFQPGEGSKQITLTLLPDEQSEPEEALRVALKNPSPNTTLMRDSILVRINDPTPKLEISTAPGGKIALKWNSARPYFVEKSMDGRSWEVLPCTPSITGAEYCVLEPSGGPIFFYRLKAVPR